MPREIASLSARKGRPATYDWDAYTDGVARAFVHGTEAEVEAGIADFSCEPASFDSQARAAAKAAGLRASCRRPSPGIVEFQTLPPKAVEVEVEDTDESVA